MKFEKNKIFTSPYFVAAVLTVITFIITAQNLLLSSNTTESGETTFTHYNNYLIFKRSFFHLIENKDLYQLYLTEHWDLFKYSPTFSLLMAPLAWLPDSVGLFIWNLLNVLVLFFALWSLKFSREKTELQTNKTGQTASGSLSQLVCRPMFIIGFILIELITSIQNSQCNALMAGLIIFAFVFLEKKQTALAALFIVLAVFIKPFGLVGLALFIFYPNKFKAIIYSIGWMVIFAILPLIVISASQLSFLYHSWFNLLQNDHNTLLGISVAGWLKSWFGFESKYLILITGVVLFCLPFLKYKFFNELRFKLFFLSSILVWIVIFNHKAESPTFVIAISGVAIWFFSQKVKTINLILLIIAFIFTILSPTDIFPKTIREHYVIPYALKAVPCLLIWIKITFDLIFYKSEAILVKET